MTQYLSQGSLALLIWRAFVWGVMLGAVYSVFGIRRAAFQRLRIPRPMGAVLLHTEDFLICITGAVGLSILYFATTNGVLRVMAIPILGFGLFSWRKTGGRLVEICTDAILHLLAATFRWMHRRILAPIGRSICKAYRRIRDRNRARRERRYLQKLTRVSRKMTQRYQVALSAACGVGQLPLPEKRLKRCKSTSKRYRSPKTERNRPNEK